MAIQYHYEWPIFVQDRQERTIYLTQERWEHALDHPGMHDELLEHVLGTIRMGRRSQDPYDPIKPKYTRRFLNLPTSYTHVVVVVKFGWQEREPSIANNFVLTAYLVERW